MQTLPSGEERNGTAPSVPIRPARPEPSPIFYGPDGLRAGWSILAYVAIVALLGFLANLGLHRIATWLHIARPAKGADFQPPLFIIAESTTLLVVVLATALMGRIERHRAAFYGLAGPNRIRQFFIGLISGFAFLSLLVGILTATHCLTLSRMHMPPRQTLSYAAAWGLCFFLVGMTEELMLRGYLLFTLARGIRFWPAAFLLAAVFGLLHKGNPGESPFGLVAAALIALVFSLSLWMLRHLCWANGFHASWAWAASFFYRAPHARPRLRTSAAERWRNRPGGQRLGGADRRAGGIVRLVHTAPPRPASRTQ